MKKLVLAVILFAALPLCAAQTAAKDAPAAEAQASEVKAEQKPVLTREEQHKLFQARNKEIRKLTKAYRNAKTEEKKAQIKARLSEIVSAATDEGIGWSRARIAAERANLDQWEKTLDAQETNLDQVKAQRVDDILSGEAERRHKLAQKRWKQEMKDRKKYMK